VAIRKAQLQGSRPVGSQLIRGDGLGDL